MQSIGRVRQENFTGGAILFRLFHVVRHAWNRVAGRANYSGGDSFAPAEGVDAVAASGGAIELSGTTAAGPVADMT